ARLGHPRPDADQLAARRLGFGDVDDAHAEPVRRLVIGDQRFQHAPPRGPGTAPPPTAPFHLPGVGPLGFGGEGRAHETGHVAPVGGHRQPDLVGRPVHPQVGDIDHPFRLDPPAAEHGLHWPSRAVHTRMHEQPVSTSATGVHSAPGGGTTGESDERTTRWVSSSTYPLKVTRRSYSAPIPYRASRRSSPSTPRLWVPPSAGPVFIRMPRKKRPSSTCSACPRG